MLGEVPVVFVVMDSGADADAVSAAVLEQCRVELADFKVPVAVYPIDEMPKATLDKVAKAELRKLLSTDS
jgi:crotonobetaine/carnitine-CoA ligase